MTKILEYPTIDLIKTGENIARIRKEKGITVARICEVMGFENPQSVYKWQRGSTLPSVDNLYALSRLLGTTMEEILVEEERKTEYGSMLKDLQDAGPSVILGIIVLREMTAFLACRVTVIMPVLVLFLIHKEKALFSLQPVR